MDKFIKKLNTIDDRDDIITPSTSERSTSNQTDSEKENNIEDNSIDIIITNENGNITDKEFDTDITELDDISNNNINL